MDDIGIDCTAKAPSSVLCGKYLTCVDLLIFAFFAKKDKMSKLNPIFQVIWDQGHGNPVTLGRKKNRTCHALAHLVLT